MISLIDGDIVTYRCASSCEPNKIKLEREPLDYAIARVHELLHRIHSTTATKESRIFLSSDENFRKSLDPNYKANRTKPKPEYDNALRHILVEEWGAELCPGYEADDGIGIAANEQTIICSIDKDLRQIPGWHYDFVKGHFIEVDAKSAIRNFYTQLLVGDSSDNVIGIRGIGPVRAGRILDGVHPSEMEAVVWDSYRSAGLSRESFICNYSLLFVLRNQAQLEQVERWVREGTKPEINDINRYPIPHHKDIDFET